ncbi:MAG: MarR family transcriptional regulator [Proteobacteria bacterium]|nr:MarR family transcriptional regulator [Pseudomonadota bacterium]
MGAKNARPRPAAHADAKLLGDPAHPDFKVADWPFYLIARTARRYEMDMEEALRRIDMDVPSWRAIMLVHEQNPSSVSEIAERAVNRLSTMTRVVQRLEKRGLVKLDTRAADARVTDVFITPHGEEVVEQVRAVASRIYQSAFKDLSAVEVETLNNLLLRVFNSL